MPGTTAADLKLGPGIEARVQRLAAARQQAAELKINSSVNDIEVLR